MLRRIAKWLIIAFLSGLPTYLGLLLFPYPLFAYHAQYENLAVYSDQPISSRLPSLLGEVQTRLRASPLNDPGLPQRIFICNHAGLFAFFANVNYRVGGVSYAGLNRNIFLRKSNLDHNRLVGPSGREVPGERTLVYFLTHEITHALEVHDLGRYGYRQLPVWKREGYADYVGRDGDFHFQEQLAAFQRNAVEVEKLTSAVVRKGMGLPLRVAGLNLHVRTVVMRLASKPFPRGGDSSWTSVTLPESSIIIRTITTLRSLDFAASAV